MIGKDQLKRLREEFGKKRGLTTSKGVPRVMSQSELADELNMSIRSIQWWELGHSMGKMSERWFRMRLKMLGLKFDWL